MPVHQLALFASLGHLGGGARRPPTMGSITRGCARTSGCYFTWWDRAMGTTAPTYEAAFDAITTRSLGADQLRMQVADPTVARVDVRREGALGVTTPQRVDVDSARRVREAVAGRGVLRWGVTVPSSLNRLFRQSNLASHGQRSRRL